MLGVTLFGLFLTPVFFVAIELALRRKRSSDKPPVAPPPIVTGGSGFLPDAAHGAPK
jgi:hypothetical protein